MPVVDSHRMLYNQLFIHILILIMNILTFFDTVGQITPVNNLIFQNIRQIGSTGLVLPKIHMRSYVGGKDLKLGVDNHNPQRLAGQIVME